MSEFSAATILDLLPEAFVSGTEISREVSRAMKAGRLRKLASRLYTRNLTDPPEAVVKRNLWGIVAGYFPGALIADRTALENAPAEDGSVCLVAGHGKDITLPGHVLRPRRGIGPQPGDRPFIAGLFLSSTARAILENMRASRSRGGLLARTLSRRQIEERLDTLIRRSGEDAANRLRDEVCALAPALDMVEEAAALNALIGTLLGTREAALSVPAALARRLGRPYDPDRLALFQTLHRALRNHPPLARLARDRGTEGATTLAFFEAYFSNFIEGTEFAVDEAADIVFRDVIPRERSEDAHDVLGTWRIVSDRTEMRRVPQDAAALSVFLKARHATILASRPDKRPGEFKQAGNRAGATVFVAPDLVTGTLEQGFDIGRSLEAPFQRAVYMMFLIAEVHPFADGNGRAARIMMNAELVAGGEERIVIPTVYRANYLSALKALSQSGQPEPLIRMLDFAQKWTVAVEWGNLDATRRELEACNAFLDPNVADEEGRRLRMPGTGMA
ncbi:MAG: Fic family protein [Alphaproteobacteria bacterium]|nr:Fic family protein [Alphaproteobacteria bacterium]